jgi:glycosyltransferase involved in cell wall biosynthesis
VICLTMIVRNEARSLARCLDSAAPFVDEMLVVDTGSTDDTCAIAAAHGARVAHFAWCDDFAAARNHALALTDADWRLVLDADEWIEQGGADLRELARPGAAAFVGQVKIVEAHDDAAAQRLPPLWVSRWLPRGPRFAGRVHEQIVHELPVRRLRLVVGHDGYQPAQRERKIDRNERLLRRALEETPDSAYLEYQLGREREIAGDHAEAARRYARACTLLGWPAAQAVDARALQARHPWLHDLVVRHLYCLKRARRFEAAQALAQAEAPWWTHSPDFHFALGDLLLDCALAEPQRAGQLLPRIEASWLRCLELGEVPELDGAIAGRGSFLAAHNLAVFHEQLGNAAQAAHFRGLAQPARP